MLRTPVAKMTERQLVDMIKWHQSFALMWKDRKEPSMEQYALEMARNYQQELDRRRNDDAWSDPDR